jgi:two-component system, NtrC family, nitrogen regulation sensor histidine kinase NtrY
MVRERSRFSLEGKLALLVGGIALAGAAFGVAMHRATESAWLGILFSSAIALPAALWLLRRFMKPVNRLLQALAGGIGSLRDNDFSVSIAETRQDELGDLVRVYNELGGILRNERQELFQRELLLDTLIQSTPLALVLTNARDAVVYSNSVARRMFANGRRLEGRRFPALLGAMPAALQAAVQAGQDGLFAVESEDGEENYHLSQREFVLNAQPHRLFLFKQLTREINRQEVATWKKVIRIIGHELNNSLAPISSLAHSGSLVLDEPERLAGIFATIEERSNHLKAFIEGYARFAKLPQPQPQGVDWRDFLGALEQAVPFTVSDPLPEKKAWFDPAQVQQVMINLLKNAHESGSAPGDVRISVVALNGVQRVSVSDRGTGMPEKVLKNALLPFYSTKQRGSGLGLPLCREIVEAHGGRLSLSNREGGGLSVEFSLPDAGMHPQAHGSSATS